MKVKKRKIDYMLLGLLIISLYLGNLNINVGISIKPYMIVMCVIFIYIIKDFYVRKLYKYELMMILFFIAFSLTSIRLTYPEKHIRYILALIVILAFYFIIKCFLDRFTIKDLQEYFVYYSNIAIILSLAYYVIGIISVGGNFRGNNVQKYGMLLDRGIPRLTGLVSTDPNIFVFFLTIIFFYTLNNFNSRRNKLGLFLSALVIILTFSRGAYLAIGFTIIIMFLLEKNVRYKIKLIINSILVFISFIFIGKYFSIDVVSTIMDRFKSISSDGGSGRTVLWSNAITSFKDNPIFGIGINSTTSYGIENYGNPHYVHNSILEILSEGGIFVFLFFMIFIIAVFCSCIKLYKLNNGNKYLMITLIALLIQMIFLSIIYNEMFYFFLLILQRYLYEYDKNKKSNYLSN